MRDDFRKLNFVHIIYVDVGREAETNGGGERCHCHKVCADCMWACCMVPMALTRSVAYLQQGLAAGHRSC